MSRWFEVWSIGNLDELPSEGLEGDVLTGAEFEEQVRQGSSWQAAGDVLETTDGNAPICSATM